MIILILYHELLDENSDKGDLPVLYAPYNIIKFIENK